MDLLTVMLFSPNADLTISNNYHVASDRTSPRFTAPGESFAVKFVVIKHFGCESLNVQPSCCLDVAVYMLNCVIWRHIPLEYESKSRGSDSNAQRYHP